MAAQQRGATSRAIEGFVDILSRNPDDARTHANLSLALFDEDRRYGALSEAKKALAINPELEIAHFALAIVSLKLDDTDTAEKSIASLLQMNPNSELPHTLRCAAASRISDMRALETAARDLLRVAPRSVSGMSFLSRALTGKGDLEQGEQVARQALAINARSAEAHVAIGEVFYSRRRYDDAKDAAMSALHIDPTSNLALRLLAKIEARRKPIIGWINGAILWLDARGVVAFLGFVLFPILIMESISDSLLAMGWHTLGTVMNYVPLALFVVLMILIIPIKRRLDRDIKAAKLRSDY